MHFDRLRLCNVHTCCLGSRRRRPMILSLLLQRQRRLTPKRSKGPQRAPCPDAPSLTQPRLTNPHDKRAAAPASAARRRRRRRRRRLAQPALTSPRHRHRTRPFLPCIHPSLVWDRQRGTAAPPAQRLGPSAWRRDRAARPPPGRMSLFPYTPDGLTHLTRLIEAPCPRGDRAAPRAPPPCAMPRPRLTTLTSAST